MYGIALGNPAILHVFNIATSQQAKELPLTGGPAVWCEDDSLAVGEGNVVQTWSARNGEVALMQDFGSVKMAIPVTWTSDGGSVVTLDGQQIAVLNKDQLRVRTIRIEGGQQSRRSLAWRE